MIWVREGYIETVLMNPFIIFSTSLSTEGWKRALLLALCLLWLLGKKKTQKLQCIHFNRTDFQQYPAFYPISPFL